jgi:hypothetical protein
MRDVLCQQHFSDIFACQQTGMCPMLFITTSLVSAHATVVHVQIVGHLQHRLRVSENLEMRGRTYFYLRDRK